MSMTAIEAFHVGTDAFNAHDIDGFAEVLADDVVFDAPGGLSGAGKPACAEFYREWFDSFPDAHVDVEAIHVSGDVIVEQGTFTGTHRGVVRSPTGDISPTGRSVSIPYVHVLRFADGKHVAFSLMFDRLLMLEQLGVVPTPTASNLTEAAGVAAGRGSGIQAVDVPQCRSAAWCRDAISESNEHDHPNAAVTRRRAAPPGRRPGKTTRNTCPRD